MMVLAVGIVIGSISAHRASGNIPGKLSAPANASDRTAISALSQKCLDAQGIGCCAWEKEIDERVAALYGIELGDIKRE